MAKFEDVFNPNGISGVLFFNVKPVLTFQFLEELREADESLAKQWYELAKLRYGDKYPEDTKAQTIYERHAPYYAEFTKIAAISYGSVYMEEGNLKRYLKKIVNDDESIILATFMDELKTLSSEGVQSTPSFFPTLCGYNITNYDIPMLIKKHIKYRDNLGFKIPLILKRTLDIKPWESGVINIVDIWKFNGYSNMPIMAISDYLGLKKTVDVLPLEKVSEEYWNLKQNDEEKAMEFIGLQSATETNLVIQLMNTLRNL